jgi:uncharacterized protein
MQVQRQRIAIIGSGISGLTAAYFLNHQHEVVLYEANSYLGGHTNTVDINVDGKTLAVDTGFLVFNDLTYPNLIAFFKELNVESYESDMSFGVSVNSGALEWAGTNLDTVFAQRKNLLSLSFLMMLRDILRFNRSAHRYLHLAENANWTLGDLLKNESYGEAFSNNYLVPMAAAIWSSSPQDILRFPAQTFLRFCLNHALLQVNNRPKWRTVQGGAREYVKKIAATLNDVRLNSSVLSVSRSASSVIVHTKNSIEHFDQVIFATHAPDTITMLSDITAEETQILASARYQANFAYLHTDESLLPKNKKVWSAWNYLSGKSVNEKKPVCVSYLLNQLQNLDTKKAVIVTLNPTNEPAAEHILAKFSYDHPIFDQAAIDSQKNIASIQGIKNTWFAGAWTGYGFHEDGLKSALRVLKQFNAAPEWAVI